MSDITRSISEAVERVSRRDPTLKHIDLNCKQLTDSEVTELVDCLITHPDVVTHIYLYNNRLTDETGTKMARYLVNSTTIKYLTMGYNQISEATHLALAAALKINTSLSYLLLPVRQVIEDKSRVDMAFVDALILNPNRPIGSMWMLYSNGHYDFNRLKKIAEELGHPTMQALLAIMD